MRKYLLIIVLFTSTYAFSQSTIRVMQYNLLYYGGTHYDCSSSTNNINDKNIALQTIMSSMSPKIDVLCVNELDEDVYYADYLLENALEANGEWWWSRANAEGSDIINMIYYDSRKLGLVSHRVKYVYPRIINFFKMYVKSEDLAQTNDTIFITFISAHLKAGSDADDVEDRDDATTTLLSTLEGSSYDVGNYVLLGDFNFYSADEAGYQNLLTYSNSDYRFYDPIDQSGEWHNNYDYADYHTQSTHTTSNGCAITGGLDDRFDIILISDDIKYGNKQVEYKYNSYKTIGQDGNHFNDAVNDGYNGSVSTEVVNALYNMSDHLPVTLELNLDQTISVANNLFENETFYCNTLVNDILKVQMNDYRGNCTAQIFSITGKLLMTEKFNSNIINIDMSEMNSGMYVLRIYYNDKVQTKKIIKVE